VENTPENTNSEIQYRPLGIVKDVLEGLGAEVSYVYEDLVFVKHNHFLLQFGDIGKDLFFYQNTEIEDDDSATQFKALEGETSNAGIELEYKGKYNLAENDDGTISIEFLQIRAS